MKYVNVCLTGLLACALGAGPVSAAPALAAIVLAGQPSYRLEPTCGANKPALTFSLTLRNAGTSNSPAIADPRAVQISDMALPGWSAGAPLPAISAGSSVSIVVQLAAFSNIEAMRGIHHFQITVNKSTIGSVGATIPAGYCNNLHANSLHAIRPSGLITGLSIPIATPVPNRLGHVNVVNTGNLISVPAADNTIAAPGNVSLVDSAQACGAHVGVFGSLVCPAILSQSASGAIFPLGWDWSPCTQSNCISQPDGFHIYIVGASRNLAGTQNDPSLTVFGVPENGTLTGACFAVTAFHGQTESAPSKVFCSATLPSGWGFEHAPPRGIQTSTFEKVHAVTIEREGGQGNSAAGDRVVPGLLVGFVYKTEKADFPNTDTAYNTVDRLGILFDVSSLAGKYIQSATLSLGLSSSVVKNLFQNDPDPSPYATSTNFSCAAKAGTGQGDWWDSPSWFDANWFASINSNPAAASVDVTSIVRSWAAGSPNYGFVFQGSDENMNAFTENACQSTYQDVWLVVKYA